MSLNKDNFIDNKDTCIWKERGPKIRVCGSKRSVSCGINNPKLPRGVISIIYLHCKIEKMWSANNNLKDTVEQFRKATI